MSILKLDGVDLYYEVHGDGAPVVFIHGASGTHLTWWRQVEELRKHFTCIIFDQRGFGNSRPTADYNPGDVEILYRDLRALIEHVGFGDVSVSVVGASLGTATALHYAVEHSDLLDRLIMVCGPGGAETPKTTEGWLRRAAAFRERSRDLNEASAGPLPSGAQGNCPSVRSPGEIELFWVEYHTFVLV
jgi:pimeloyl-ACP methyl ester carboxylesterase